MTWRLEQVPDQAGRIAIVTGANIGLGYETALTLAGKGCTVVLACRNMRKATEAKSCMLARFPRANVECMPLDLLSLSSVRKFAAAYAMNHQRLDLLINNAGIMMPTYALSENDVESQFAANYLGHFALTGLLFPLIVNVAGARVVSLSSLAHRWSGIHFDDINFTQGYDSRQAYGQSKLACLMFAYELQRRLYLAGASAISVAAHPGVSSTNLFQNLPALARLFTPLLSVVFQSAEAGALPILYAALGDDIVGGNYCGPRSLREMRGAPVKVRSNRGSHDEAAATRLWSMSEEMTGLRFLTAS